ncbi:EVE domain-containing protein [Turicibacter bilis]|uniref:EVE domain-containing protein n=1 Tax=Turicibacter bilis TaxID=2735723 RepID=A0A9Q9CFM3_9FIRM|nr:AAA family ATPase [Turicibacter bilis]MBS3197049.1 EVE domain-containing protein [Turicibacter bilis]UUF07683.1 EVE domain-containing protein [Turicibacter bilis]
MSYWIFQGNPDYKDKDDRYFDITKYVFEEDILTWEVRQRHCINQIKVRDLVFIWRSDGKQKGSGGIIAKGIIISEVRFNEEKDIYQVDVKILERKVTPEAGMVLRSELKDDIYLSQLLILKQASGTNYRLSEEEFKLLEQVWNKTRSIIKKDNMNPKDSFFPMLEEYNPRLTATQYEFLLENELIIKRSWLDTLYYLYQMGGQGTCKQIAIKYGDNAQHYNSNAINIAKAIHKETNCKVYQREDGNIDFWPILFYGKDLEGSSEGVFIWKLREPLLEAIQCMEKKGMFKFMKEKEEFARNMILYGPPGTGKTYHSAIYAIAICDHKKIDDLKNTSYEEILSRYNELKRAGRISFTTFHQSYGYEEFIEGIQPMITEQNDIGESIGEIGYRYKDGVFKQFCKRASTIKVQSSSLGIEEDTQVWCVLLDGTGESDLKKSCFKDNTIRIGWHTYDKIITEQTPDLTNKARTILFNFQERMKIGDIVLIQKSNSSIDAIGVITGDYEFSSEENEYYPRKRDVKWIATNIDENITNINGEKRLDRKTVYSLNRIDFFSIMELITKYTNQQDVEEEPQPYVFIIDEINRGNISKIFGELITLIEETKRLGSSEEITVSLPYTGDLFGVPNNVYVLGTMNTADRSIALMDTALRRRFQFIEMMPNSNVLNQIGVSTITVNGETLDVVKMLDIINKRIEYLFDREHMIGHAFFTSLKENPTIEQLASIFKKSIIPLLQEYFYEDYEKIQLVLGDNGKEDKYKFILDEPLKIRDLFNGSPDIDLPQKRYRIQEAAFYDIQSYKKIGLGL